MTEQKTEIVRSRKGQLVDRFLNKAVSRKLLVWVVSTVGLFTNIIDAETWGSISLAYIGSEAFINMALAWKTGKAAKEG